MDVPLQHQLPAPALHRLRGGSPLRLKEEEGGGRVTYARRVKWIRANAWRPDARRRRDGCSASCRCSSPSPADGTGVDHERRPRGGRAWACCPPRRSPCAAPRRSPCSWSPRSAILLASLLGYAVAASGLGPVLATGLGGLPHRPGAVRSRRRRDVRRHRAGVHRGSRCAVSPVRACSWFTTGVIAVMATVIGDVLRSLHERNRQLEELRDVEKREAVAQDRVRIAREVHDIVGHALAAITLQARAGRGRSGATPRARPRRCARSRRSRRAR